MRENRDRKLIGICARRSLVICIGDDYSRNGIKPRKLLELVLGKRDRIDNMEPVRAPDGRRKELSFYRRIVVLPDPEPRGELLEIGGRHGAQNAWINEVKQGVAL